MRSIAEYLFGDNWSSSARGTTGRASRYNRLAGSESPLLAGDTHGRIAGIVIKRASGELGDIGVGAGHDDRAKIVTETRPKSHKLGHAVRVLHSCHVALLPASCFTRLGLWILPVGVRGSSAAVRKARRAGTL